jgi:hypothetical protein
MGERPYMQLTDEQLHARFTAQNAALAAAYADYLDLARELDHRIELARYCGRCGSNARTR